MITVTDNNRSASYYADVSPLQTLTGAEQIIPAGETWLIKTYSGTAGFNSGLTASIKFGDTIVVAIHGESTNAALYQSVTGDGTTALKVVLENNTISSVAMGMSFDAARVET